jgi:hypothetical protein
MLCRQLSRDPETSGTLPRLNGISPQPRLGQTNRRGHRPLPLERPQLRLDHLTFAGGRIRARAVPAAWRSVSGVTAASGSRPSLWLVSRLRPRPRAGSLRRPADGLPSARDPLRDPSRLDAGGRSGLPAPIHQGLGTLGDARDRSARGSNPPSPPSPCESAFMSLRGGLVHKRAFWS